MIKKFISLERLKEECKRLGIMNGAIYKRRYKEIQGAPSNPSRFYKEEWISWFDFFDKVKRITLQRLKEECNRLGINTLKKYLERYKEIKGAPNDPKRTYGLSTLYELFDNCKGLHCRIISLDVLKKEIKRLGIKHSHEYRVRYKEIENAPSNPQREYKEWISFNDLFSREVKMISLKQLKETCKQLKINSLTKYKLYYRKIKGAPCNPDREYKKLGVWVSWSDFFGRDEVAVVDKEVRMLGRKLGFCKVVSRNLARI